MPRTTREWAHRKIDQATNLLDTVCAHLAEVTETYADPEPDIAAGLVIAIEAIVNLDSLLNSVKARI